MNNNDRNDARKPDNAPRNGGPMTRFTAAPGLIFAALLAAPGSVFAQSFLGEWTATAHTPGSETSETLHVTETDDGYSITAKLVGAAAGTPEAGPGEEIVLDGDSFSYIRTIGDIEIVYAGVVSGDTFTGTVEMFGTEIPYTGVRGADAESQQDDENANPSEEQ